MRLSTFSALRRDPEQVCCLRMHARRLCTILERAQWNSENSESESSKTAHIQSTQNEIAP